MSQHLVTLLLGSNLGDRKRNLEYAMSIIESEIGIIEKRTKILITEPVEFETNNFFCNIAVLLKTQFSPIQLLKLLKNIEHSMGRENDTFISKRYTDRTIDIDIVLYDKLCFCSDKLQVPHVKHLYQREFSRKLLDELTQY